MLREIAEYPNSFGPLGPKDERLETDRFTLCMAAGKRWNTVQRQHFRADEVDEVVEEVRSLLRARGRESTQWEVGSSAKPPDLVELLLERGLVEQTGRAEVVGRPALYGTTSLFLEYFGLSGLDGLPAADELRKIIVEKPPAPVTADAGLATNPPEQLQMAEEAGSGSEPVKS